MLRRQKHVLSQSTTPFASPHQRKRPSIPENQENQLFGPQIDDAAGWQRSCLQVVTQGRAFHCRGGDLEGRGGDFESGRTHGMVGNIYMLLCVTAKGQRNDRQALFNMVAQACFVNRAVL